MRTYRNKSQLLILFLTVGFLVGIIYENVVSGKQVIATELFLKSNLERYLKTDIVAEKYFWYVLKERILLFAIICVLGCMKWKKFFVALCLGVVGFLAGILTVSAVLQLGIKGILFCLVGIFPQGILYSISFTILFAYWYQFPERRWNRTKLLFVIVSFILGIVLETYVNPLLLKWVIQIL